MGWADSFSFPISIARPRRNKRNVHTGKNVGTFLPLVTTQFSFLLLLQSIHVVPKVLSSALLCPPSSLFLLLPATKTMGDGKPPLQLWHTFFANVQHATTKTFFLAKKIKSVSLSCNAQRRSCIKVATKMKQSWGSRILLLSGERRRKGGETIVVRSIESLHHFPLPLHPSLLPPYTFSRLALLSTFLFFFSDPPRRRRRAWEWLAAGNLVCHILVFLFSSPFLSSINAWKGRRYPWFCSYVSRIFFLPFSQEPCMNILFFLKERTWKNIKKILGHRLFFSADGAVCIFCNHDLLLSISH